MNTKHFTTAWLGDPTVFSVNELPVGSDHEFFATQKEMAEGASSLVRNLDGVWKAHFAMNPAGSPDALLTSSAQDGTLRDIPVPCEFQLVNPDWDGPQYVNYQFPWDGHEKLTAPEVSEKYNPTVTAIRTFPLSLQDLQKRIVLHLAGVETAVLVYVNGHEVGYAEDSFTGHKFDITPYVRVGENRLALRIFKRSSANWLEDQDFWRWSGIHRSVELHLLPETHLQDIRVRTPIENQYTTARLDALLTVQGSAGQARITLADKNGKVLYEETRALNGLNQVQFDAIIPGVKLWSAELPHLYPLTVTLTNQNGQVTEVSRTMVGFRQFEMGADKIMRINGKRIMFHGVNRHEFDCDNGRVLTVESIRKDIQIIKSLNINAIRTSHYPNRTEFYRLCDEFGLYVIDETNIESHGYNPGQDTLSVPGDKPEWRGAVLARGRGMYERDKNHPCVLIWSCGNESWNGENLLALSNYYRQVDPTRLVHYEGCSQAQNPRYFDTSDVRSHMYATAAFIEEYLKNDPPKPFISCEYTHAMGNSCGGMNEYTALEDKYPMYQGGFIWDYVDQGLRTVAPNGQTRYAYGGDFGDRPTDWAFIGNGIVFADRTISPKGQEVKYLFRDVFLKPGKTGVTVTNRKLFAPLDHHSLRWTVEIDRVPVKAGEIVLPEIAAGDHKHIDLNYGKLPAQGQIVITCFLVLREDEGILPAGTIISHGQTVIGEPVAPAVENCGPAPIIGDFNYGFRTDSLGVMFENRGKGLIAFRDKSGRETLLRQPQLSLFRASTDNDDGNRYALRQGVYHLLSRYSQQSAPEFCSENGCTTLRSTFVCPAMPELEIPLTFTLRNQDELEITLEWPGVENLPDMPALGLAFQLDPRLDTVKYYGLGPEENYVDRRDGAYLGWHGFAVKDGATPYLNPQESGNRGGVQVCTITDRDGHGIQVSGESLEISVQPWLPEELQAARHTGDLMGPVKTVLDVALFRKGVAGDNSWGAQTLPKYCYPAEKPYTLTFTLKAL